MPNLTQISSLLACMLLLATGPAGCGGDGTSRPGTSTSATSAPSVPPPPPAPLQPPVNASAETAAAASGGPRAIEQLLPADGALVDRMDGEAPAELTEAVRKFKAAAQRDPEWFQAAVQAAGPGVQMAYDPRMGVTREEYELIVRGTELIKMKKVASVPLQARRSGNLVELDGGEGLPEVTGVVFDLTSKTVTTPYGTAVYDDEVQASEGQKMTGPWNGHGWKLEKGNAQSGGTLLRIYLGQLTESGRGLLVYDLKHLDSAGPKRLSVYLNYDLP